MGYEILYSKAGIQTSKGAILLMQAGSDNCFETNWKDRSIPEKHWSVFPLESFQKEHKDVYAPDPLAAAEQIRADWGCYGAEESEYANVWKSRRTPFKKEELARWVAAGIRNACPLEDYIRAGNTLEVFGYLKPRTNGVIDTESHDFSIREATDRAYPRTSEELDSVVSRLREDASVGYIHVGFQERDIHSPLAMKRRQKAMEERESLKDFFVIEMKFNDEIRYFMKKTKYSVWLTDSVSNAKIFKTQSMAQRYLDQHPNIKDGRVALRTKKEA